MADDPTQQQTPQTQTTSPSTTAPTSTNTPPLGNDPSARNPDGSLKGVTDGQSLLPTGDQPDPTKPSDPAPVPGTDAPYTFTPPKGTELDPATIEAATPLFRELGLDQAAAQKLVDFYTQRQSTNADKRLADAQTLVADMRAGWRTDFANDKDMAGKAQTITTDFGRALDRIGDPKIVSDFKAALDLTGAGDHPAVIKALWSLSKMVNESQHVAGGNPSPLGQLKPGESARPTTAQAMWPNLRRQ